MDYPFSIDFAENGGLIKFRSVNDVQEFVQQQLNTWSWIPQSFRGLPNNNDYIGGLSNFWTRYNQAVNAITASTNVGNADDVYQGLTRYFIDKNALPIADGLRGRIILGAKEALGARAGFGALAAVMELRLDAGDPLQMQGFLLAYEQLQSLAPTAKEGVQKALAALLARFSKQQKHIEDLADIANQRIQEVDRRRKEQFYRLLKVGDGARKDFSADIDSRIGMLHADVSAAIDSIKQTERTYSEHMGLKAPVTYWQNKSKQHKMLSRIAMALGALYATGLVSYIFMDGATRALSLLNSAVKETGQVQIAYVVLTIVAFLLTISFWIGRLISRTYVSQTHLAIDAEERATMVLTYLALTNENKIDQSERVLVLTALFRASSDGLVKDDASPDLSLAGIASRLGAGPGAGQK